MYWGCVWAQMQVILMLYGAQTLLAIMSLCMICLIQIIILPLIRVLEMLFSIIKIITVGVLILNITDFAVLVQGFRDMREPQMKIPMVIFVGVV